MLVGESMVGKEKNVDIGDRVMAVKATLVFWVALYQFDTSYSHLRGENLD